MAVARVNFLTLDDAGVIDNANENHYHSLMPVNHNSSPTTPKPLDRRLISDRGPERVTSEALLGAAHELVIVHAGREYRLRLTQNGKLILTA